MSTRSTIAVVLADGSVRQIYCHFDGSLRFNGRVLNDCYTTQALVEELINTGDLSTLGETMNECVFYGRDLHRDGEFDTGYIQYDHIDDYLFGDREDFDYIFEDGEWYVRDGECETTDVVRLNGVL